MTAENVFRPDPPAPARVAIVGSRGFKNRQAVEDYVNALPFDTVVISGGAKGVDTFAEQAARKRGMQVVVHLPDWTKYGKSAGMVRNREIIDDADRVVAFFDGTSPGTKAGIAMASRANKLERVILDSDPVQRSLF